jgi:hypothetical protein
MAEAQASAAVPAGVRDRRAFWPALVVIVLVGVIVRVVYAAATQWHALLGGDAAFYTSQAVLLVRGRVRLGGDEAASDNSNRP